METLWQTRNFKLNKRQKPPNKTLHWEKMGQGVGYFWVRTLFSSGFKRSVF